MSANGGECFVEHPSHLCKEDTICTIKPGGLVRQNALCLACDSNLVISVCECGDCAKDCRAILEGPRFCFKGKHTIEALPVSDKRRVSRNVITILAKHNMQVLLNANNETVGFSWKSWNTKKRSSLNNMLLLKIKVKIPCRGR